MALLGAMSLAEDQKIKEITEDVVFKNIYNVSGPQFINADGVQLYAGTKIAWEIKETTDSQNNNKSELYAYQTIGVNIVNEASDDDEEKKLDAKAKVEVALCAPFEESASKQKYWCTKAQFDRESGETQF